MFIVTYIPNELKLPSLNGFLGIFKEKTAASPLSGNPAVSLLETRGFPSLPHGRFGFGSALNQPLPLVNILNFVFLKFNPVKMHIFA